MGANAFEYNVKLNLNAETKMAKAQINDLQKQLQDISKLQVDFKGINNLTNEINEASTAAMKLQANLQAALNPDTGTLDFSKFNNSIRKSGESISGLAQSLLSLGPQGEKAFVSLADSISRSEVPLMRTNKLINGLWDNLKKTAGWQVSSSVIHGVMGQYQQAMGYAKALDKSLNDIRIVTGQSADQMARFAKEANTAAKKLSTTTTDYTNASLIYYQQGLSDAEVKKRSDITIKMANATGTNAAKVSDQLTSIWNNFDNGTKSLEHYADVMTALGAATASSTDEIAKGIQKFAAISDTVGLSYEYAASALATITATTRESADTVGNSLKTLFSRIQGLQLGETLDDGTTLNKYSTALAKVGISIKDSSGALKDMNSILDEMGTKWHTLAEDQQMALAQTVGGVRQYTQIMTLMENWDFFKENLNTANTATGALTMQAEIYADSWEAASERMRASMESVWDTLIDSDSFKSLLNIGSTILDGINSALAGIGGGSGVLATAAGIFGTVFKTQISQSLVDGIHTITHLTPKAMAAERQKRTDTINEMIMTVNDPGATPYMGDYERQRTVDILRMQRDASEERSKRRSKMSSEAQAMDVELETSLGTLYDRRKSIAAEMDTYQDQIDRGRQATADDLTFFSESYNLKEKQPTSSVANAKKQLENARRNGKNTSGYEARLAEAEAQVAAQKNYRFGLALLKDSDSGATADQNASLGKALEQLGIREANAEDRTAKIITELSAKKEPGEYSIAEGKLVQRSQNGKILGGNAYELFADLLNLTPDERVKFRNQEQFTDPQRQALGIKLDASLKGLEDFIKKDLDGKGITDQQERSKLIGSYIQKTIGGIQADALSGLGVNTTLKGMQRGGAMDIYQGAKGKRTLEITDANVEQAANKIKAQQDKLRQENYASVTSATTGLVTGGFQTAAGMQGLEGAFKALSNGDIIGASAGAASAFYNLKTSRQNLSEAFSDLDPLSQNLKKSAEKTKLLQEQNNLNESVRSNQYWRKIEESNLENLKKEYNKKKTDGVMVDHENYEARITDYENRIKQRKEDEEKASGRLNEVSKGLEQLKDIDTTKFPKSMGKLGDVLEFASKNADKAAGAFQAAQIAMKLTSEGLNYIYNTNQRNAEKAAAAATQLEGAYAMNQRNHNALISGIEEYNKATEKLKDTNLTGAAKSAAIYEQNQQALDLAMKYNLETTQMGDTIKIDEKVLKQAEEDSIQSMQVSKYAMNAAKIDSKEAQNKREEERLERETGVDEGLIYGGLTAGAGALAAALMFIPGVNLGVAAAAGIAAGAALITGKGVDILTDTMRENSAIDKAVALTRETGSTAWMDKEDASELSGLSEKELQKYRKDIEALAKSEFAAEQAERQMKEANANDILRNNDETEDFEHANKLQEGLIKQQEDWYENQKEYHWWNSTSKSRIEDAKSIESELGLTGSVVWQDDKKNSRLTYTTSDGQTGEVSYDTMAKTIATKEGKADTDQYIDTMMNTYEAIKAMPGGSEDAAAGMLSLLSGGDFESATMKEIDAAKKLLENFHFSINADGTRSLDINQLELFAQQLGISDTDGKNGVINEIESYAKSLGYESKELMFKDLAEAKNETPWIADLMTEFTGTKDDKTGLYSGTEYSDWFNKEGKEIFDSMDQAAMKEFYKELSFLGNDAGTYLSSLSAMLDGINPDRIGDIMKSLTSVDWSNWSGLESQVIGVLDQFNIKIEAGDANLEQFVKTIQNAAMSLPNLAASMEASAQTLGTLEGLKLGDKIDETTMQSLKDAGWDMDKYTFTTWSGENILTRDIEHIKTERRQQAHDDYNAYMSQVDAVTGAFYNGRDDNWAVDNRNQWLKDNLLKYDQEKFLNYAVGEGTENNLSHQISKAVLGDKYQEMVDAKKDFDDFKNQYELTEAGTYRDKNTGELITKEQYQFQYDQKEQAVGKYFNIIQSAAEAAVDPSKLNVFGEQIASTYNSLDDALADTDIEDMISKGTISEGDIVSAYALANYPELTEQVEAYAYAVQNLDETQQKNILTQLEENVAMQDAIKNYKEITGKKADLADLSATITALKNDMDEETAKKYQDSEGNWNEEELIKLAEETMIAGVGWSSLQKDGSSWATEIGYLKNKDATAAQLKSGYEAAGNMGKAMQQYLGLTEYDITGIARQDKDNPIVKAINDLNIDITKILNKDVAETNKLRAYLVSQSTAGKSLTNKLGIGSAGKADEFDRQYGAVGKAYNLMKSAINGTVINEETLAKANSEWAEALNSGQITWEEYSAGVEMATGGQRRALTQATAVKTTTTENGSQGTTSTSTKSWNVQNRGGKLMVEGSTNDDGSTNWVEYNQDIHGTLYGTDGSALDPTKTTTGGSRGGSGSAEPIKVQVKSAQELMTRYKTIDQKLANTEMQKTLALQQKDLLYGQSKISQLNKINTLLKKQQQLTTDRIVEEMDYLEKDKKRIEEVIERYNKKAKEKDKIEIEFNSEGLISNYKELVGKWAEELADMYADGKLTESEGKKAKNLEKKIQDFNTIIQDYEDSLNQLNSSIEQYENTLYEMLSAEVEILAHNVEYHADIVNDNLAYINFYSTNIKDSIGSITDYLELMNAKITNSISQLGVYEQGYTDILTFINENPLQLWATQGVEGMLTSEQVTTLHSYRDNLISTYNTAMQIRQEIEEQLIKVFDYWNKKIDKNSNSISRFTDMLSQFKDIINIVGKDVLGLSNSFIKIFEQQSIDQSFSNIEASRIQYEGYAQTYMEAQEKLEEARTSDNEKDIEYWEEVVEKTKEKMESAQDAMLTSLNHALTTIAEQFTNAVNQTIEDFNDSLYEFGGLDDMISDYDMIREQADLMVEDYEKIYNLNKLNRNLEKTLNDTKLIAGKQKLLEFQKKINEINKSNVELSQYELEYLQAEYELKLAEIELENSRNSKDTVRLSKDSEGNWSYIYTQNDQAIDEAEQKYEDALFKMQQLSRSYTEEMSSAMMEITQQMRDEIAALAIQDFETPEAYNIEVQRIQEKYQAQLAFRESELNKSINNNADLYKQDWLNYSKSTGYKISADADWIDSFQETTLGGLMNSSSDISDFSLLIANSINTMNKALDDAASKYFVNANKALTTYGSSLKGFGMDVTTTTAQIIDSSKKATEEVYILADSLVDNFGEISDKIQKELANWTEQIGNKLDELLETIKSINDLIAESASKKLPDTNEIIGQEEAVSRLNAGNFENKDFAKWEWNDEVKMAVYKGNDKGWNFIEFNADLVQKINEALQEYANIPTSDTEGREAALAKLNSLIKDYWIFKRIIEKIYDQTINIEDFDTPDTGSATEMATGGYTGEWGNEGKYAVLHEKELILNKDDTANFLDALNISRDIIHSMIEMNAKASSLALGNLIPSSINDTSQILEQQVSITAEFPNATDHNEIAEALDNLINTASQYANRFRD